MSAPPDILIHIAAQITASQLDLKALLGPFSSSIVDTQTVGFTLGTEPTTIIGLWTTPGDPADRQAMLARMPLLHDAHAFHTPQSDAVIPIALSISSGALRAAAMAMPFRQPGFRLANLSVGLAAPDTISTSVVGSVSTPLGTVPVTVVLTDHLATSPGGMLSCTSPVPTVNMTLRWYQKLALDANEYWHFFDVPGLPQEVRGGVGAVLATKINSAPMARQLLFFHADVAPVGITLTGGLALSLRPSAAIATVHKDSAHLHMVATPEDFPAGTSFSYRWTVTSSRVNVTRPPTVATPTAKETDIEFNEAGSYTVTVTITGTTGTAAPQAVSNEIPFNATLRDQ